MEIDRSYKKHIPHRSRYAGSRRSSARFSFHLVQAAAHHVRPGGSGCFRDRHRVVPADPRTDNALCNGTRANRSAGHCRAVAGRRGAFECAGGHAGSGSAPARVRAHAQRIGSRGRARGAFQYVDAAAAGAGRNAARFERQRFAGRQYQHGRLTAPECCDARTSWLSDLDTRAPHACTERQCSLSGCRANGGHGSARRRMAALCRHGQLA